MFNFAKKHITNSFCAADDMITIIYVLPSAELIRQYNVDQHHFRHFYRTLNRNERMTLS